MTERSGAGANASANIVEHDPVFQLDVHRLARSTGLRLVGILFTQAPTRSSIIVGLLIVAGLFESLGVFAIFPLLVSVTEGGGSTGEGPIERLISGLFDVVGFTPGLTELIVLIVIAFWLKAMLILFAYTFAGFTSIRFMTDIRMKLIDKLIRARWVYFTNQPVGTLGNALVTESIMCGAIYNNMFTLMSLGLQTLMYVLMALWLDWRITIFAVLAGGLMILAFRTMVEFSRQAGIQQTQSNKTLTALASDQFQGIKPLKAMALETAIAPLLMRESRVLERAYRKATIAKGAVQHLSEPLLVTVILAGLGVATIWFEQSMSSLLFFTIIFYRGATRLSTVQQTFQTLVSSEAFVGSIASRIADLENLEEPAFGTAPATLKQGITFEGLSFSYPGSAVLRDVNGFIPAGKMTTIHGPSGAGKTTLVDLVIGLNQAQSGRLLIDGTPIEEIDIARWRRSIGYVPQELILFNDTVRANITMGQADIDDEAVMSALKRAGAADFVAAMKDGLDTMVGERGAQISGGQRQRISLARALIREPSLLILDEPTTALDPVTEAEICKTLQELGDSVTILAISHQQALVDTADHVFRMQGGVLLDAPAASRAVQA